MFSTANVFLVNDVKLFVYYNTENILPYGPRLH